MTEHKNDDGFKFAITILPVIFGYLIIKLFDYLQNTSVDIYMLSSVASVISSALISSFLIIIYILIKGFSMEIQDSYQKNQLDELSTYFYILSFFISIVTLISSLLLIVIFNVKNSMYFSIVIILYFIILIYLGIKYSKFLPTSKILETLLQRKVKKQELPSLGSKKQNFISAFFMKLASWIKNFLMQDKSSKILFFFQLSFVLLICEVVLTIFIVSLIPGHINTDMESIYYKNNAPIPVSIKVTGQNTGLSIGLLRENINQNITLVESINLEPNHNSDKVIYGSNSILFGNAMEFGKYDIFINTTNLTSGYYELVLNPEYGYGYGKAFYLLKTND